MSSIKAKCVNVQDIVAGKFFKGHVGPLLLPNLNFNCILKNFLFLICSEKNFWPIERMKINSDVSGKRLTDIKCQGLSCSSR